MPTHDFIQVRVFVDGEEATEYEDPSAIDEDNKCVRYIDTRPGQKFSIKATWLNGFRIRWADGLSCRVQKGDEYWYDQEWLTAGELLHNKGALTHPASIEISNSLFKDPNTSKEVLCDWALEGLEMSALHITIFRAKKIKVEESVAEANEAPSQTLIPVPQSELPEQLFKGGDVKQTFKYTNPQPYKRLCGTPRQKYDYVPKNGPAGEEYHFIFKHRDKKALQNLGCIPRETTPPPDPVQLLEHLQRTAEVKKRKDAEKSRKIAELEAENKHTKRKVDALKRLMARLLSTGSPKVADFSEGEPVPTPTTSDSEINDTEAVLDVREITNPNPKEKVTIELTGDSDSD